MNDESNRLGAATLFNNHVMEFRARIDTLLKSIFLISGGILSITIGTFLSGKTPSVPQASLTSIQYAWYFLSFSIIAALTTMFLLIIAQAQTGSEWKTIINTDSQGVQVIQNPIWFRVIMWLIGVLSFICCVIGIVYIAYGAGQIISTQP